jgi:hypothetical protein
MVMLSKSQFVRKAIKQLRRLGVHLATLLVLVCLPSQAQAPVDLRVALVIGNSAYPGKAALANPANDAIAMSEALRGLGFTVVESRDASRAQMLEAISKVRDALRGKQGVGMLYYAGHGLQLEWRNFMVPVDAKLSQSKDVPEQTVELSMVIDAFKAAGNRMNIVVLDACRDNPFAGTASGKGLAQLDAPTGTFLAFATAPGNVADDGAGQNGLYTGFLLQELKKPQAKIEDVFKRVRLNVRQKSEGRQIPWESTSLEDDFFFNTGIKAATKPDEREKDRLFSEEKAEWDKIKESKNPDDFYAFLKKYPSGLISEAVTARLNAFAKPKIEAAPIQGREGNVDYDEIWKLGSSQTFTRFDLFTKVQISERTARVTAVTDDRVEFNGGEGIATRTGAAVRSNALGTSFDPPLQAWPASGDYQVGKKWTIRSIASQGNYRGWTEGESRVAAYEDVAIKMGVFKAYRIEMRISTQSGTTGINTYWVHPKLGMIKFVRDVRNRQGQRDGFIEELKSATS